MLRSNLSRWLSRDSRDARARQKNADRWNRIGQIDWRAPQRWILQRVFDLGWTEELFGSFDHAQHRRGRLVRDDNRFEGIDRKYTWIALYEMLSYLQDAADFNDEDFDELNTAYCGPWQLSYIRNIDASRLEPIGDPPNYTASFPKPPQYIDWTRPASDAEWIKQRTDLPNPLQLLGSDKWLLLNGAFDWEQPTEPGEDKYDIPRRNFWLEAQSCLVAADDADAVSDWLLKHDILNEALPKPPQSHCIFLGEFFRTLAFQYENEPYYCRDGWTRSYSNRIPAPILITVDGYLNESGYDCSFENNVNLRLPCEYLVNGMELRWNGEAGFIDKGGNLIAVDPAYWGLGPCQLLVSRDKLLSFLKSNKLDLVWLVRGQKRILGERWGRDAFGGQLNIQAVCQIKAGKLGGTIHYLYVDPSRKQIKQRGRILSSTQ